MWVMGVAVILFLRKRGFSGISIFTQVSSRPWGRFLTSLNFMQVLRCKMLSDEFSSRSGPELQRLLAVEESR